MMRDTEKIFDAGFYRGKRVLVTGHTGFKGSWMCAMLRSLGAEVIGYSTHAKREPSLFAIAGLKDRITDIKGDVRDLDALKDVFNKYRPEIVIHMAAQPIVRTGYEQPVLTYGTNVMGTVNLLECVRLTPEVRSVVNVTTDKVYRNNEWCWGYRETEPLDGYDPYSNSKSCSELVTHSYINSFFAGRDTAVSTARAGNVIGGGDFARDRIIPDCARAASEGTEIIVRNPYSVRPFQHVLEPVTAYLMIAARQYGQHSLAGCYNVGPEETDCVTAGALADLFCTKWGDDARWKCVPEHNAVHEANYLRLDCSLIRSVFGWKPAMHIDEAVDMACRWYKAYYRGGDKSYSDANDVMDGQIAEYLDRI